MNDESAVPTPDRRTAKDTEDRLDGFLVAVEKAARGLADMAKRARSTVTRGTYDAADVVRWIKGLNHGLPELRSLTEEGVKLEGVYQQEAQDQLLQLEAHLRQACEARGWRVDGE